METFHYQYLAEQASIAELRGSQEKDRIFVRLQLYKSDPLVADYMNCISQIDLWVKFSLFKMKPPRGRAGWGTYARLISVYLECLGVREDEHPFIVQKHFDVIEAAVSPVDPVVVKVYEAIYRLGDDNQPSMLKFIPATRSSIQALEPVVTDTDTSCVICFDDSEQEPFTQLPCTHRFHLHCIVRCLEINHLCPMCRYAMPTQEEEDSTCPE